MNVNKNNVNTSNNKFVDRKKLNFVVDFGDRKILQIGNGGVGSSMEYLYKKHLKFKPGNITIMDKNSKKIEGYSNKYPTINFVKFEVTKDNYKDTINKYLGKDDVLIDLAWYISTPALLELCHEKGIHFVNTAIEAWYEDDDCKSKLPKECETLYRHQHAVRKTATEWGNKGATAVVSHGANPGWVSHAMKLSLRDWINFLLKQNSNDTNVKKAKEYLAKGQYNEAARLLNVQVIHIAERDTQISKDPKHVGEFCCTWSCTGLIEEGNLPAELGYGTHEDPNMENIQQFNKGEKNEVYIPRTKAMNSLVQSCVPSGPIVGNIIPHEEANSISYFLTVKRKGKAVYRPTCHYSYMLPDLAIASLHEYQADGCPDFLERERVMKDDIISGKDELGVLMMSPRYGKWYTGSLLDIETSRKLIPHQSATVVQVSASVFAAMIYALKNNDLGVIFPEDMDSEWIMENLIMPYLGEWHSSQLKWEPELDHLPEKSKYKKTKDLMFAKFLLVPAVTK